MILDIELAEVPDGQGDIMATDSRRRAARAFGPVASTIVARRALDLARTHERREEDQGRLGGVEGRLADGVAARERATFDAFSFEGLGALRAARRGVDLELATC